jgi:hypothetical protein
MLLREFVLSATNEFVLDKVDESGIVNRAGNQYLSSAGIENNSFVNRKRRKKK